MFEKILFATTASPTCDAAANVAFDLAKKYNSQLTVFHILGFPTRGYSPFVVDIRTGDALCLPAVTPTRRFDVRVEGGALQIYFEDED